MTNPRSANGLVGYTIHARDGNIGEVLEFFFDDATWAVRYVVVDVRKWLLHRKVLLAPVALSIPDDARRCIPAATTRNQVRSSPKVDTDQPIALQHQALLHAHYGWEMYWGAEALMGGVDPELFQPSTPVNLGGKPFDPNLRTTRVVTGHKVVSQNGIVGRVEDFLIDCTNWTIQNLRVRTHDGGLENLSPSQIARISFKDATVFAESAAAAG